jgi:uncharacterized protein (DUF427 family)
MATRYLEGVHRDELRFEPTPKRVRAELGGSTFADSTRALLVWEPGRVVPVYAFPQADVRQERLRPAADPVADAHGGAELLDATRDRGVERNAAWRYADPDLRNHVAVAWESMDRWLEEDEEVYGHPRDPFHRVDARQGSRHVRVTLDDALLADSRRPVLVFETGLPTRYYLPRDDVLEDALEPSATATICAYKGRASYWSVRDAGPPGRDLAWSYLDPLPDARPLAGLVAFLAERCDVTVDGERQARPRTQWSDGVRHAPRGGGSGAHQAPHGTSDLG